MTHLARRHPDAILPETFPPRAWMGRHFGWSELPETMRRDRVSVAFHEAAHAVVSVALGLPFDAVVIEPYGDSARGWVGRRPETGNPHDHDLERQPGYGEAGDELLRGCSFAPDFCFSRAVMFEAGLQAEMLLAGFMLTGTLLSHFWDQRQARHLMALVGLAPAGLFYVQRFARSYLTHTWPSVARVAEALLQASQLDSEVVQDLVGVDLPDLPKRSAPGFSVATHED